MPERLPKGVRSAFEVLKTTVEAGDRHDLGLFAAAVAYSLVLSLAPLSIALNLIGVEAVGSAVLGAQLPEVTGEDLYGNALSWAGSWSTAIVILLVLFGASTLFGQLVRAISRIWEQGEGRGGLWSFLRTHVFGFVLLAAATVGLFASAVIGNTVSAVTQVLGDEIPLDLSWLSTVASSRVALDLVFASVLFTVAFTTVPRIRPRVTDVLPGSLLTAAAYALGQWGLSLYLSSSARFTALGAFGTLLAFLVWAYYTASIMLWGAQMTHEIARRRACARGGADTLPYTCAEKVAVDPETEFDGT